MNYYQPRQRQTDGRYDYTKRNDDRIWAVGYCAGWREWKDLGILDAARNEAARKEWEARVLPHKDKYHSDGHATPEEAAECYKQFLLDQHLKLNVSLGSRTQEMCAICDTWTQVGAEIDMSLWPLCLEHENRESVDKLFEAPMRIISSY